MVRLSVCRLHISHFEVCIYHIGVYISDEHPEDQALFVTERCCFTDLVEGLSSPCPCGLTIRPWALESVMQVSKHNSIEYGGAAYHGLVLL